MIFARRAGVEVVQDPAAPPPVPRPTRGFCYDTRQRDAIEAHLLAHGWTVDMAPRKRKEGGMKRYVSPEGKCSTGREYNTLNVVVWFHFPQFLKVNSQERAAELAREKAKEEEHWKEVPALHSAEIPPPLRDEKIDPTTSITSTPNGGTSYRFVRDAEGLFKQLTLHDWKVQQHEITRHRRYIPPNNLATSSTPYYSLADVARDFYHSFLTTFTYEPQPPIEPQPHAKRVAAFLEDDDASKLCIDFQNITLTYPAARMDIDEESNETNPFTAAWTPPTSERIPMDYGSSTIYFDPFDPKIDKSALSGEFSVAPSKKYVNRFGLWPPGGLWRRLVNGKYVRITRPEDARIGDLYVIPDGRYKGHTLYVRRLFWEVTKKQPLKFTKAEVDAYNEDGILPAACGGRTVHIRIQYSFLNPKEVNKLIPTCFAWADRKLDGTALYEIIAWKEMIAERPYGLCCSLCDNYVGKPVFGKDGEVLYYQTVTQFEQDGVDPRHKEPRTVGIAYREYELRQGISEWKCRMCHGNKSVSEQLRPDEKHLASGTDGAWPNSLPPWEK